jgi:EPS-associated MarR family transcriptional regulator
LSRLIDEDVRFRLMRLLEQYPEKSQRDISRELGVSLGAVNYMLKALIDKGEIKIRNFTASENKLRYAYVLTPRGIEAKARLTLGFLKRKRAEYEALRDEIASLEEDLGEARDGEQLS